MITEEEIQQKAEMHIKDKWSLKMPSDKLQDNHPVESTVGECKMFCRNDYIAGYKQCQQDMLKGNVLIGQMEYNRLVRKAENVKTTDV